ncbi:TPA: membrane lipoprotein lipid attachment site-containing protein [Campylobacter lari]|uniref:membrane lipoprotein lipid attachment site-containing protein n=1 Tax=Campylobacter sp. W0066.2 TaxID=2735752 RepID=UPI002984A147|nr:membrane lipoprotein lipid attachment site-containing protein [Campylobacter sp. W0066.2]HEG2581395.1 membrane lipoprotein lipid attachment site-containing protein [Campylobacter lari]
MKKILLFFSIILFLSACAGNQKTYYISMPNFKSTFEEHNHTNANNPKVKINDVEIIKSTFYSSYFEQSTLNQRINKSLELLKKQLLEDSKALLQSKGYIIDNENPDYVFNIVINANLYEDKVTRNSSLGGDSVESSFMIILEAQSHLNNLHQEDTFQSTTSSAKLNDPVILNYPIKGQASIESFREVYSAVPTQLNESLAASALEIDKVFVAFYKEITSSLKTSVKEIKEESKTQENSKVQDVKQDDKKEEKVTPYQNNEVIIFE